ncbi:MAG: outer membrane lipoprotein carrier protein LolA [Planctomycetota bacterium]
MNRSPVRLLAGVAVLAALAPAQVEPQVPPDKKLPLSPVAGKDQPRPADARALFAAFAKLPGLEATYEEEKHLALLAAPLKSRGRMLFLPPGYLARAVEAPEKSLLVITPDELRIDGRDGREVIDLKRSDRVRLFVTALVQVFAGNEPVLAKSFTVDYALDARSKTGWTLVLLPKEKALQQMIKSMTLRGEGVAVTAVEVEDPNGDRTVTKIVTADANRTFDAAEKKRWFGIEPR